MDEQAAVGRQRIVRERRDYNRWVANQTLEDYALRFTAKAARRWSAWRVAHAALGVVSFLALEAIGGAITLTFGVTNAVAAILVVAALIFVASVPICYYAARDGVDVDLLTRGAGFGYIGSTITSLIYASFTFIFFSIEAVIVAAMLESFLGIPLWLGYILCALVVIPIVVYGFTFINRLQIATQPLWFVLNLVPLVLILGAHPDWLPDWRSFTGSAGPRGASFDLLLFGGAASILFALITQTAEQVDVIRFLPDRRGQKPFRWWTALLAGGPGWIVIDVLKLLAGSFLAYAALRYGLPPEQAVQPHEMYLVAFRTWFSPGTAVMLVFLLVTVSQLKINVINAYAGSLAWSNFFSRLTHAHPGRVVWLVFNIMIALLLMELGIHKTIANTLVIYSDVSAAWMGALIADLVVNKPLGWSPRHIEFKRAHLYDINPVGVGAMMLAGILSLAAYAGWLGVEAEAFSTFIAFAVAFATAPMLARLTGGRFYLARKPRAAWSRLESLKCSICEHDFEPEDMAYCPVYAGPICSLCCTLDARCQDGCKPHARLGNQILAPLRALMPGNWQGIAGGLLARFLGVFLLFAGTIGLVLFVIHAQTVTSAVVSARSFAAAFGTVFVILLIVSGIAAWLLVLAQESRRASQAETKRQTALLMAEIRAHRQTDAALQQAKEAAEAASLAKSRYVVGISHELRSPLNAILGYAQLLEHDAAIPEGRREGIAIIRRSGEHLTALIEGLLDISKIEAGRIALYRDELRLPLFLDQLVQMLRVQADAKGIAFHYDRPKLLPELVYADEQRLRQVLINLLSNAIKFTTVGQVTFRLRWRNEIAEFEVEDTGPGIAEADKERIFEPFQRLPTASGAPGTGLGLTISKLLTAIMGGELTLVSELGKGSRFRVRLMLARVEHGGRPASLARQRAAEGNRRVIGHTGERRSIMVVDDDMVHRRLIADMLTPLGLLVLEASDGASGLALAKQSSPDLFLVDIRMPGPLNGWELARQLRAEGFSNTPILIVSATLRELQEPPHEETFHDDVVSKPIDLQQLLDKIGHYLRIQWTSLDVTPEAVVADVPFLSGSQLAELRELAAIGYVRGIRNRLDALEQEFTLARPFISQLKALLADYRLEAFTEALDKAEAELAAGIAGAASS
ncbi:multi-sensor hybrid histidine kinase [Arboricoccus pini]|uniref:histidine kinase n=1 Tax=Arboricoccus pini TaxID=1963835 RepID=A0A212RCG5_9PROT|nr:ATP-binding protein [Arboricoccus pini]SNB69938.1 multi-sensor hybrid histidine kinase [Arboricoccus pini]